MRRLLFVPLVWIFSVTGAWAAETWLALYLQGTKIGYASTVESDSTLGGKAALRSDSRTFLDMGMLGANMTVKIDSTSWLIGGKAHQMDFYVESAGRTQKLKAKFLASTIELEIDNNGERSKKTLDRPKDAEVVDDPISALLRGGAAKATFYVLDPLTVSLVKNTATTKGKVKTQTPAGLVEATLVEVSEPRATTKAFFTDKGDLIKVEAAMGIEMRPVTKEEALAKGAEGTPPVDIAEATRIRPKGKLPRIETLASATFAIVGRDLTNLPNDAHQTVKRQGAGWKVTVNPRPWPLSSASIAAAKGQLPLWTKPSLYIPSQKDGFRQLARTIVGKETDTARAAKRVHAYVFGNMRTNAGIGVLRDASEVLKSKEGVCRDYAILTATLLRAADIPTRVCSGLIYFSDAFYYHAWVEFWDGKSWIGLDSTRPQPDLTPAHLKLAHGSVEQAFNFTFLESTTIEVKATKAKR